MSGLHDHSGSESEDDDFNPQPEIDEEDGVGEKDDGSSDRPEAARRRVQGDNSDDEADEAAAPAKKRANVDDEDDAEAEDEPDADGAADDDEDEDEEDEDDEDEVVGRARKRRKRDARMQFIDVEAEVDDEDEEEIEEDDEIPDETHPDDLLEPGGADLDDRRHRELDRKREAQANMDAEQQAALFNQKYGHRNVVRMESSHAPQTLTLPTVNDPAIWGVKVKPTKEREVIFAITKRIEERANSRDPLRIYSAFERGGTMTGYIYVEADSKQDLMEALEDLSNVYVRSNAPINVDVKERPDLLRKQKSEPLKPGQWVRMKRPPLYAGDLAKVYEVEGNGLDVSVQLVPRLDYGLNEDANAAADANKRKRGGFAAAGPRPPRRLFNEADAKKKHMKYLQQVSSSLATTKHYIYRNDTYINGLLIKDVKISHLITKNVDPKMDETADFGSVAADGTTTLDLNSLAATLRAATSGSSYVPGDNVEIYEGEQKGVVGTTVSVTGDIVTLKVTEGELKGRTIDAPVKTLRKLFRDGDHVKVIGGSKYVDEVGLVVKIKDDRVTLLTDSNQQEITVFSKDLKRAADSGTVGDDSNFDLYDLVQLDAATVACVIKVDRETLRVLDQTSSVRTVLPSQIANKLEKRKNAVATDRDGSEIHHDDTVKEHGGESRQGRVLYIHRNFLFVQNREQAENYGIFVVRSTNVTTMAAKGGRVQAAGPDLSKMNPSMMQTGANGSSMPPPRSMGRDKLIGKTVTVRKGPHKGLLGIVKDTNGDDARIELHTKNKTITVKKEVLAVKDPITGTSMDFGGKFANRSRGSGMPSYSGGNSTPSGRDWSGSRTPAWGGAGAQPRAPSWATPVPSGSRTPAWNMSGGRTPGWGASNDGSRTAYGGNDGSRTAYGGNDGSRTAYSSNDGSRTSYGGFSSGGRTPGGPAWGAAPSGSKTPSHSHGAHSNSSSNSNNAYHPPTPSATFQAPTPAPYQPPTPAPYASYAGGAPTPAGPVDAPTPGFSAPTPGDTAQHPTPRGYGYSGYGATPAAAPTPGAPTPGAWPETPWGAPETPAAAGGMGEDDPRYE